MTEMNFTDTEERVIEYLKQNGMKEDQEVISEEVTGTEKAVLVAIKSLMGKRVVSYSKEWEILLEEEYR